MCEVQELCSDRESEARQETNRLNRRTCHFPESARARWFVFGERRSPSDLHQNKSAGLLFFTTIIKSKYRTVQCGVLKDIFGI